MRAQNRILPPNAASQTASTSAGSVMQTQSAAPPNGLSNPVWQALRAQVRQTPRVHALPGESDKHDL